jgi:hypothetical protein
MKSLVALIRESLVSSCRVSLILLALAFLLTPSARTQTPELAQWQVPEWAWMGGNNVASPRFGPDQPGVYGTQYQFAESNAPGPRNSAVTWTDQIGRLWLFGGDGFDSAGKGGPLNDLWVFNPFRGANGEWAWMGGSDLASAPGEYGIEYQFAASNTPGARNSAVTWTDQHGKLWLFSGVGEDSSAEEGVLNDLWVFDPLQGAHGEWAWMGGSNIATSPGLPGPPGNYGTEFQFAQANIPGARNVAVTWTDRSGRLWLFGGVGYDSAGDYGDLNDLWVFDPSQSEHGEWAWMGGSDTGSPNLVGPPGNYGTEFQFAASNMPGARDSANTWTDQNGILWLFGGTGFDSVGNFGFLNDLWAFDPSQGAYGEWAWMGGNNTVPAVFSGQPGVYGTEFQFAAANTPGGRISGVTWTDLNGRLWLSGGDLQNDLWVFDLCQGTHGEWAWMGGGNIGGQPGLYGTEFQFAPANTPGARTWGAAWTGLNGRLWLLGGLGDDTAGNFGFLNDLWQLKVPLVRRIHACRISSGD